MQTARVVKHLVLVGAWDAIGVVLLGLGLHAHYAAGATTLAATLAPGRVPLLWAGGAMLAAGRVAATLVVLRARRPAAGTVR